MPLLARLMRVKLSETKIYRGAFHMWSRIKETMSSIYKPDSISGLETEKHHASQLPLGIYQHAQSSKAQLRQHGLGVYESTVFETCSVAR
jgi:hypothetical protein